MTFTITPTTLAVITIVVFFVIVVIISHFMQEKGDKERELFNKIREADEAKVAELLVKKVAAMPSVFRILYELLENTNGVAMKKAAIQSYMRNKQTMELRCTKKSYNNREDTRLTPEQLQIFFDMENGVSWENYLSVRLGNHLDITELHEDAAKTC